MQTTQWTYLSNNQQSQIFMILPTVWKIISKSLFIISTKNIIKTSDREKQHRNKSKRYFFLNQFYLYFFSFLFLFIFFFLDSYFIYRLLIICVQTFIFWDPSDVLKQSFHLLIKIMANFCLNLYSNRKYSFYALFKGNMKINKTGFR